MQGLLLSQPLTSYAPFWIVWMAVSLPIVVPPWISLGLILTKVGIPTRNALTTAWLILLLGAMPFLPIGNIWQVYWFGYFMATPFVFIVVLNAGKPTPYLPHRW
jgi:phosphoglycerol transferase MdoB-like AlkP superfamily enzyme